MTNSDFKSPPPIEEDLEQLLRCERERPRLSAARVERMWQALTSELAVLPLASELPPADAPAGEAIETPAPSSGLAAVPCPVPAASAGTSGLGRIALIRVAPYRG